MRNVGIANRFVRGVIRAERQVTSPQDNRAIERQQ